LSSSQGPQVRERQSSLSIMLERHGVSSANPQPLDQEPPKPPSPPRTARELWPAEHRPDGTITIRHSPKPPSLPSDINAEIGPLDNPWGLSPGARRTIRTSYQQQAEYNARTDLPAFNRLTGNFEPANRDDGNDGDDEEPPRGRSRRR